MDDPDLAHLGKKGIVKKLVGQFNSFVDLPADDVDLIRIELLRCDRYVNTRWKLDGRLLNNIQILNRSAQLDIAYQHLCFSILHGPDDSGHTQRYNSHPF